MGMELLDLVLHCIVFHSLCAVTAKSLYSYVFSLALGVARSCWEDDHPVKSTTLDEQ